MHVNDPSTEATPTDDVITAMDAGIAAASEAPADPVAEDAAPDAAPADNDPPQTGTEAQGREQAEREAAAAAADESKPDPIEAEVASLNLKEKSAERFRELASEREAMAPVREAMKELGLEDPKMVAQALGRVRDADFVIGRVVETGASHDQFDKSLEYLSLVNRGIGGDREALEQAWALIEPEIQVIAKALGKEVPGIVDPLADHDDLRAEVEGGDLTRARALEIARQREEGRLAGMRRDALRQSQESQHAQQQAVDTGRQDLNALGAELKAADPARYDALSAALVAKVREITAQHPPHEWAARAARAYATLPLPQSAPAARPAVGHVPLRPTGGRPDVEPATFDDPADALDFGIAQASR